MIRKHSFSLKVSFKSKHLTQYSSQVCFSGAVRMQNMLSFCEKNGLKEKNCLEAILNHCTNTRGGFHKTSYDTFGIALKAGGTLTLQGELNKTPSHLL